MDLRDAPIARNDRPSTFAAQLGDPFDVLHAGPETPPDVLDFVLADEKSCERMSEGGWQILIHHHLHAARSSCSNFTASRTTSTGSSKSAAVRSADPSASTDSASATVGTP